MANYGNDSILPLGKNLYDIQVILSCSTSERRAIMVKVALFVRLQAKPGREADVLNFLEQGLMLANQEVDTPVWFALRFPLSNATVFSSPGWLARIVTIPASSTP